MTSTETLLDTPSSGDSIQTCTSMQLQSSVFCSVLLHTLRQITPLKKMEDFTHPYAGEIHTVLGSSSSSSSSCSSVSSDSGSDDFNNFDDLGTLPPPLPSDTIGTDAWAASRDALIEEFRVRVYPDETSTEEVDEDTMDDESDKDEESEGEGEKTAHRDQTRRALPITADQQHLLRFLMETYAPNYATVATYFNAISAPAFPYTVHGLRQYWRVMNKHRKCQLGQRQQTLLTRLVETFGPRWKVIRKLWAVANEDRGESTLKKYWEQVQEDLRSEQRG
ncbi:hypothetical protein HK104_001350 [Borealophlyctis nickersoniae]|nr:hypothetical protein HK104_001350 [Borealophlyctis nickersoniae]